MSQAAAREQLEAAREHALAGEYATATVYYEGVAAAIAKCVRRCAAPQPLRSDGCSAPLRGGADAARDARRHMRSLTEPAAKKQWLRLRAAVAEEADAVAALEAECAALRAGPEQPQRQQPEVRCEARARVPRRATRSAARAGANATTRHGLSRPSPPF